MKKKEKEEKEKTMLKKIQKDLTAHKYRLNAATCSPVFLEQVTHGPPLGEIPGGDAVKGDTAALRREQPRAPGHELPGLVAHVPVQESP